VALGLLLAAPAAAQGRWIEYVHPTFGTRITYPADILPHADRSDTGAVFKGNFAELDVSARRLPHSATAGTVNQLMMSSPGYDNVTYTAGGRNWMVVSGYRGADIFYEKYSFSGHTVQAFLFRYPIAQRDFYDPIVEAMENSFHPGR
jgi:hypothetical protein